MDPITIAAGAASAYSAVRKAIMAGQELEQMIGSVSKWVSCVGDLDQLEREAKNPPIFKSYSVGSRSRPRHPGVRGQAQSRK